MKEASTLAQTSCCRLQETSLAPVRIETNVNELWAEEQEPDQPAAQDAAQESELE